MPFVDKCKAESIADRLRVVWCFRQIKLKQ